MARFDCPPIADIVAVMTAKGYRVFQDPNGHDVNLVGIRNADARANRFDDWLTTFYWYDGVWNLFAFPGTTDPGQFYREQPLNVRGLPQTGGLKMECIAAADVLGADEFGTIHKDLHVIRRRGDGGRVCYDASASAAPVAAAARP